MNQEQLVYLKRYFHMAPPIWSSYSGEVPMKCIELIIQRHQESRLLRIIS